MEDDSNKFQNDDNKNEKEENIENNNEDNINQFNKNNNQNVIQRDQNNYFNQDSNLDKYLNTNIDLNQRQILNINTKHFLNQKQSLNNIPNQKETLKNINNLSLISDLNNINNKFPNQLYDLNNINNQFPNQLYDLNNINKQFPNQLYNLNNISNQFPNQLYDLNNINNQNPNQLYDLNNINNPFQTQRLYLNNINNEFQSQRSGYNNINNPFQSQIYDFNNINRAILNNDSFQSQRPVLNNINRTVLNNNIYKNQIYDFNNINNKYLNQRPDFNNINNLFQSQRSLNNIQTENLPLNNNNIAYIEYLKNKKIKEFYKINVDLANNIINNNLSSKLDDKIKSNYAQEIIIYKTSNNEDEFKEKLNNMKILNNIIAIKFQDLKLPDITNRISERIKIINYKLTNEDKIILKANDDNIKSKDKIFYNKCMFYSSNKISLYCPHIIKTSNDIISIYLTEEQKKLNLSDFQYKDYYKNINNDIFLDLLKKRINQFNHFKKNKGIIEDNNYNDKIFGFNRNVTENNYYLYSIMDKEIILNKLKIINYNELLKNLTARSSQMSDTKTYSNVYYEVFNKNMDFLKGLTYEELILYIILDRLENKYETLPRIIFYEYYLTINGEKVVVSDKIQPGYSELDCIIYSKCNQVYVDENPLIIQKKYNYDYNNNNTINSSNLNFEIKENTLYFFELKSSLNLSNIEIFLKSLFKKYKEFNHLYLSKKWINENTKKEIMLIYDNNINDLEQLNSFDIINDFINENKDCTFNIVYSYKSYPFFSHSLAINKYNQLSEENKKISEESKKISEENKKISEENKVLKLKIKELETKFNKLSEDFENQKNNQKKRNEN